MTQEELKRYPSRIREEGTKKLKRGYPIFFLFPSVVTAAVFVYFASSPGSSIGRRLMITSISVVLALIMMILITRNSFGKVIQKVKRNLSHYYTILGKNGLIVHTYFSSISGPFKYFIPYNRIQYIGRMDRVTMKSIWEGKGSIHKLLRWVPIAGPGLLYPNFSHPDDLLWIKLDQEMELDHKFFARSEMYKVKMIYINVDRDTQNEFIREVNLKRSQS